jgi:hypothetical protein
MRFRNGQWVKFTPLAVSVVNPGADPSILLEPDLANFLIGKAHKSKDGKVVGIYKPASLQTQGVNGIADIQLPDSLYLVSKDKGENILWGNGYPLSLNPTTVADLEPVTSRDDIPADRLASVPSDWQPRP